MRIGADPMGGASVAYWGAIAERHGLDLTVVNPQVDPQFGFMTLDWDGKIRMDCSSPYAMASLVLAAHEYQIATGNDADADRHGIVTRGRRLDEPEPLPRRRDRLPLREPPGLAVRHRDRQDGRELLHDRLASRDDLGRRLVETPVGFKWFVPGLLDGSIGFGGEESAGASFLRRDGTVWTTDKDGIILGLLASEILAVTGQTPSERYRELTARVRRARVRPHRRRRQPDDKAKLGKLSAKRRHGDRAGRRPDHRAADRGARATARRSAGSRW